MITNSEAILACLKRSPPATLWTPVALDTLVSDLEYRRSEIAERCLVIYSVVKKAFSYRRRNELIGFSAGLWFIQNNPRAAGKERTRKQAQKRIRKIVCSSPRVAHAVAKLTAIRDQHKQSKDKFEHEIAKASCEETARVVLACQWIIENKAAEEFTNEIAHVKFDLRNGDAFNSLGCQFKATIQ